MFKIEKGVPLPPMKKGCGVRGPRTKWPWRQMEIGDSFLLVGEHRQAVNVACSQFSARNPGFHFTTRIADEGVRIWRTDADGTVPASVEPAVSAKPKLYTYSRRKAQGNNVWSPADIQWSNVPVYNGGPGKPAVVKGTKGKTAPKFDGAATYNKKGKK